MARQKLGAYIRKIDYLAAREEYENSDDNPGNQLIVFENSCNRDDSFSFEELKDGYAAFREKVCIANFPGRHSPPYWVAFSTACVLERLTRNFEDEEEYKKDVGRERVYTWVELFAARPSSGHLDLMKKFTDDAYKTYLLNCPAQEIVTILSKMKITVGYSSTDTDSEQTYAMFLNSEGSYIFKVLTEDQYKNPVIQKALMELHMHYQRQMPKLTTTLATYMGYMLRAISDKFPDKNPYAGSADTNTLKSLVSEIKETLCTYEGSLASLTVEKDLKNIFQSSIKNSQLKELFPELMDVLVRFSKRKSRLEKEETVYDVYRIHLIRKLEKEAGVPLGDIFDSCAETLLCLLAQGRELIKEKLEFIEAAVTDCLCKVKNMSPAQGKRLLEVFYEMIKSGRVQLTSRVEYQLKQQEVKKALVWKDLVPEAKQWLAMIGTMRVEQMQESRGDYYEVIREQRDVLEILLEMFKKGKILPQLQEDLVTFIFNAIEIDSPHKYDLANKPSDNKYLTISAKDKGLADLILDKTDQLLKRTDVKWDSVIASTINSLLMAVRTSYGASGKNVPESQNAKFMSIFETICDGDSPEDKMFPPDMEEQISPCFLIYQAAMPFYISLHVVSKTLACCLPAIKCVMKMTKMALAEDNEKLLSASFQTLKVIGIAMSPEMADLAPEVVELFMSIDEVSDLALLVRGIYPFNPGAIHCKLQDFIQKIEDLTDNEKLSMLSVIQEVAMKHPEQFTSEQIGQILNLSFEADKTYQSVYLSVIQQVANRCPKTVRSHFKTLKDDEKFPHDSTIHLMRVIIIVLVGLSDEETRNAAIDYLMKDSTLADHTHLATILSQTTRLLQNDREYIQKYKPKIEKLHRTTTSADVKEACKTLIDVMEGKSLEGMFEDIQQAQEDIADLDQKVGATMTTVVSLGEHVIGQSKDISEMKTDIDNLEVRVDEVEGDLVETKVKVEEIDNKTMTNAPKWSRDLTKLMNPTHEYDWRLLAKRLGYSNDDIRGWAQQNDPCMALLSEWYATHKTSEATYGLLTNLQEMNRMDAVAIVENAMKAVEGVVEDEEFEYPSPPPIFLSYQWGVQNEVKLLRQHLNKAGYDCWMDIGQMGGGDKLFNKIDQGVRAAKVVISCTTEKYAQSPNCNREVNLAVNLGKPIIPLLMEKMSWPPKGSMGPIFSEYLFIRFFQRAGEETEDQRYWPVDKFKELLMQLNFYTVPDQKLVQPEYANWWKPIIEEIKIEKKDRSKESSSGTVATTDKEKKSEPASPLVFLSYQWGKQPQVKLLYQRLVSMGYSVWMDIFQMGGGDSLYDKIDRGMRGCKAVVSCVTPKYALSANCRREISLADALKKPLIPLLLEEMKWPPDGPMSMVFTELLYINMYRDPNIQETWTGEKFDELVQKLWTFVPEIELAGHAKTTTDKQKDKNYETNTTTKTVAPAQSKEKAAKIESRNVSIAHKTGNGEKAGVVSATKVVDPKRKGSQISTGKIDDSKNEPSAALKTSENKTKEAEIANTGDHKKPVSSAPKVSENKKEESRGTTNQSLVSANPKGQDKTAAERQNGSKELPDGNENEKSSRETETSSNAGSNGTKSKSCVVL